jgi:2-polyprenyl-3-methyl-5-hydroxy-6-metoxy-1,4-benzoquinol methylase
MREVSKTTAAVEHERRHATSEPGETAEAASVSRYHRSIDLDSDSTHARVVRLVGTERRVLELGPSSGHMSRVLRQRGCTIVAIEHDPDAAAAAAGHCERMVVGDLDTLDLDAELDSDRFDVIVAADVLEHLKEPASALRRLRGFLSPNGCFVISLPNVAHADVRLALLQGHFRYQDLGLLDRTHLRFFTRESICQLLDEAELGLAEISRTRLEIGASEVTFDRGLVPTEIIEALERDPDARTYQFVIKAVPLDVSGSRARGRQMRELAEENARLRDSLMRSDATIGELADRAQRDRDTAQAQIATQSEQLRRLQVRLDRILASPPARAYAMLRRLPGVRSLVARRTAAYRAALDRAAETPNGKR